VAGTREFSKLDNSAVKLTVKLSRDEVNSEYGRILKNIIKDLQIPGFRRGKVPREVLERKAGAALKEDVLNQIIGEIVPETLNKEDLEPQYKPLGLRDPEVDGKPALDLEKKLEFSVIYDVYPEVKLEKIEGLEVEAPDAEITEEDVALELENIRERNSVVMERETGETARQGDVVTLDFCELKEDGSEDTATKRSFYTFTIGTGHNFYGIDDEITGMMAGEKKTFDKEYPADFKEEALAGRKVKLQVEIRTIKENRLPELDDDLAQDVDEKFMCLDDLKKDIREKLEKNLKTALETKKRLAILDRITEENPIVLPKSLIDVEVGRKFYDVFGKMGAGDNTIKRFLSDESLVNSEKPEAERKLKHSLIMEEIKKQNNFEISEEDYDAEIREWVKSDGGDFEKVKKEVEDNPSIKDNIRETVMERKIFEFLESKNSVKKGEKQKYIDLFS